MKRRAVPALLALAALAVLPPTADADILHLEGGGTVQVERWWLDGSNLVYESAAGTVGIPRSTVVRIERSGTAVTANPSGAGFNESRAADAEPSKRATSDRREERRRLADAALRQGEYETASSYFLELLLDDPESDAVRISYVVSELALGRDGTALSVVLDGISLRPERAEYHELLGELRYRDERVAEALVAWRRAFELAPSDRLREKILKAEREMQESRHYDLASSPHFNLRFDGMVDDELAAAVLDELEEQFQELSDRFRHTPTQVITVLLYPEQAFRAVTQAPEWVGGLYDGKIRVPIGGLSRLTSDARRVLVHELTHAVVHSKSRGHAPRWLHEGLAQIVDGSRPTPATRRAVLAALQAAPTADPADVEFSYAVSLSQTLFLDSLRGNQGLIELLDRLSDGANEADALTYVYREEPGRLWNRWAEIAEREAQP